METALWYSALPTAEAGLMEGLIGFKNSYIPVAIL
jgi:hypothetical protein